MSPDRDEEAGQADARDQKRACETEDEQGFGEWNPRNPHLDRGSKLVGVSEIVKHRADLPPQDGTLMRSVSTSIVWPINALFLLVAKV